MRNIFDKYAELTAARKKVREIEKSIHDEFIVYVAENRTIQNGDKVTVYDSFKNIPIGDGVVDGYILPDLSSPHRVTDFDEFVADAGTIYYAVMAMKADGTASKQHFCRSWNMPAKKHSFSDYYIKKSQ